jgi:hypothetical protein
VTPSTRAALLVAAERIGVNGHALGLAAHIKAGRKASTYRYTPTPAHLDVIGAIDANLDDDAAMGLLHRYDILVERTARR